MLKAEKYHGICIKYQIIMICGKPCNDTAPLVLLYTECFSVAQGDVATHAQRLVCCGNLVFLIFHACIGMPCHLSISN